MTSPPVSPNVAETPSPLTPLSRDTMLGHQQTEPNPLLPATPADQTLAHAGRPTPQLRPDELADLLDATDPGSFPSSPFAAGPAANMLPTIRPRLPNMPGFDLLGELGRGGMGVVYRAKQIRLNRLVALKMLLHSDLADPSDVVRFRLEAEAVAAVKHPNVVQVFEFGHVDGRPYFAMEFLPGGSLHARLKSSAPLSSRDASQLVEKLSRAIHAAHAQGIVHRDIKPGNVLFDAAGEPRVTDFGLAKRLSSNLTQTQAVMGTPAYMAPEQANGRAKFAGPPADIYALGVILYECLAGTTPFRDEDSIRLITQVIQDAPPSLRSRAPTVPRDLERICLKCLEKDPGDRYATAAALADDLKRFLAGEPVSVRPPNAVEQLVKWARRRPTAALAYGLGLLALVLLLVGGLVLSAWFSADRHFHDAEDARARLAKQNADVEESNRRLEASNQALQSAERLLKSQFEKEQMVNAELARKNNELEQVGETLNTKNQLINEALAGEKAALDKEKAARALATNTLNDLTKASYFRNVGFAQKELRDGSYLRAVQLLDDCPPDARKWEWWHVYRTAHTEFGSGICAPAGSASDIAFRDENHNVTTVHPTTGCFTPFRFKSGGGVVTRFHPTANLVDAKLSADGNRVLTIRSWNKDRDEGIEVWDLAAGIRLGRWTSPTSACLVSALSGNGRVIVVGYEQQPLRAYDVETGKLLGEVKDVKLSPFPFVRMSHDGATVAVPDADDVIVWKLQGENSIRRIKVGGRPTAVAVSPDGNTVAMGDNNGGVHFHDLATKKSLSTSEHFGSITTLDYSEDGKWLGSGGEDGRVRIWNATTGKTHKQCLGHTTRLTSLRFNRASEFLVSVDSLGSFRVWDVNQQSGPRYEPWTMEGSGAPYFLSHDLTQLFAVFDEKRGVLSRYDKGESTAFGLPPGGLRAVGFQPGGEQLVLGGAEGDLFHFEKLGGKSRQIARFAEVVESVQYTPDGKRFLVSARSEISLWDSATLKKVFSVGGFGAGTSVAVSSDGQSVIAAKDRHVRVWNVVTNVQTGFYTQADISAIGFTPSNDRIVAGTRDWKVEFWEPKPLNNGLPVIVAKFVGHTTAISSFAFNSDGTRLVTGAADGTVKVWDVESRQEAIGLNTNRPVAVKKVFWGPKETLVAFPEGHKPVLFDGSPKALTIRPPAPPLK